MRKQVLGIILFAVIAGLWIGGYEYISSFFATFTADCGSEDKCAAPLRSTDLPVSEYYGYEAKEVVVKLQYVTASVKNETVKTRLTLDWQGAATPPGAVWVQLQFHNYDGSTAGWASEPLRIPEPFESKWVREVEPVFECGRCADMPRNLYATARVWTKANAGQNVLHEARGMQPVLVQE